MDRPKVTPKDFFLWIAAMVFLYGSLFTLIRLLFDYIDYTFPDPLNYYIDPYSSSMRVEIASLIVLFPAFLVMMHYIRKDLVLDALKKDLWIRRWALYLTVFIAGLTVIGTLITLVNYFLGGEITTRFILKILVVLLVAGGAFLHFLADIWGYWVQNPQRARLIGWGAGTVVATSIVSGFFIMGSPAQIRLYKFDDQKVGDLQNIQWQIVSYWQQKGKLPVTLSDLQDPISGYVVPNDPQTGESYEYKITNKLSFELCGTFNAQSRESSRGTPLIARPVVPDAIGIGGKDLMNDTWQHGAGRTCFARTIDPERYPPHPKQKISQ